MTCSSPLSDYESGEHTALAMVQAHGLKEAIEIYRRFYKPSEGEYDLGIVDMLLFLAAKRKEEMPDEEDRIGADALGEPQPLQEGDEYLRRAPAPLLLEEGGEEE